MSASLELEIKNLLDTLEDPAAVLPRLLAVMEASEDGLTPELVTSFSRFCWKAGLYVELIDFVLVHFELPGFQTPWPYFLEAVALSRPEIEAGLASDLLKGITETKSRSEASRSRALDLAFPELRAERADRRIKAVKAHRREKDQLMERLVTLRTQQLYEQERQVLERLQKMYPGDADVAREARDHKDRFALEILARHGRFKKSVRPPDFAPDQDVDRLKPKFAELLTDAAAAHPEMVADLAIAAAMLDLWEDAHKILGLEENHPSAVWLRLELLLKAGRHVEVLSELAQVEREESQDADTFMATAYLRAQAMWGLGQKDTAIEIMESLLANSPQYRSGLSLLSMWRGS